MGEENVERDCLDSLTELSQLQFVVRPDNNQLCFDDTLRPYFGPANG
jgi:hypothetical protein